MNRLITVVLGAATLGVFAVPAHAHVSLETQEASASSYYKAVFRVPHGCGGSATVTVRVQLPEGIMSAKPQPKAGWQVEAVREQLAEPTTDSHGNAVNERVSEIRWTGGHLPDDHYDEFTVRVRLPDAPDQTLYFPVVQECEQGVERWIEIPAAGEEGEALESPAPQLRLTQPVR